ncbi:methylase involved in ubiquinone/menaquinone biosynthesis [Candidatus Methanoperedens nitroreducens]|uniref:Methylase involved in ubiquinone/menaquinone biosynthesis n=1 Tax=Candidatus Methanoperedens nitratireducens TaxID=1392998 RepID=A0A062V5U3_9EURY|nr:class I SAM-dependent methyltransferase [Candidatus Methanoperedens nitroreducens]KCZ72707.1 methylase involved in ubiquinone/menaquinone biosynthesis [Candidatus Methanoperedens nitroreducens]MDJ1423360.1 class I SAM-dependent methyltransferase [Candidatus Methanoperedens sp.]
MVHREEKYWSKYARSYDEGVEYVVGKTLRQAIVKRLLGERDLGEVIEFGCGTGYFTKVIAKNARNIIATDLSDEMLEVARIHLKDFQNVTIQKANCESTSFPSQRFDTVFMANVIHTIENPYKALQESHRILRDGGLLLITSYTDYGVNWFEKIELSLRYLQKFGMPPGYYRNYSPNELARLVENAGFKVEEIQLISNKAKALYLKGRKFSS